MSPPRRMLLVSTEWAPAYETYFGRVRSLLAQENDGVAGVRRR